MSLIDRYVYEVGRHLPGNKRADIQAELRSLLTDALEDRANGEPSETEVVALLKEYGPPKTVAASYAPERQFLIGPSLFPLFKMVAGIALAAVIGAQLLAWGVLAFIAEEPFLLGEALGGLVNSIPITLGWVVLTFAILQWFDVQPELDEADWDPQSLPHRVDTEPIKRGELIFEIAINIVLLAVFTFFADRIGVYTSLDGGSFFGNPVLAQYVGWIIAALILGIGLNVFLLWRNRWETGTRIAKFAGNIFGIVILSMLVQSHSVWLAERGAGGLFSSLLVFAENVTQGGEVFSVGVFRLSFLVALIVTIIETLGMLYRLIRASLRKEPVPTIRLHNNSH